MDRPMRVGDPKATGFVMRPSAALALLYIGACAFWLIGLLLRAKYPPIGTPLGLISVAQLVGLSVANATVLIALVADGLAVRRHPPHIRLPHLVGVVFAAVNLLVLQVGVILAYQAPFAA